MIPTSLEKKIKMLEEEIVKNEAAVLVEEMSVQGILNLHDRQNKLFRALQYLMDIAKDQKSKALVKPIKQHIIH